MSESNGPGDIPSDLPPEYAEAYRRGYERARSRGDSFEEPDATQAIAFEDLWQPPGGSQSTGGAHAAPRGPFEPAAEERTQVTGPLFADEEPAAPQHDAEPTQTLDRSSLLGEMLSVESDRPGVADHEPAPAQENWRDEHWAAEDREPRERPAWLVPLILGVAAIVLILLAFIVGKWVAGALSGTGTSASTSGGSSSSGSHSSSGGALTGQKYTGPVKPVAISGASASCQAPNAVDASGNPVSYAPRNMIDGNPTTAWRCDGNGVGQKLTFTIPAGTKIGEVGLIPGYAKTDPASGADRYAENDRITKVRWVFDGGKSFVQTFDGSAGNRSMQTLRIPVATSGTVTVEILRTTPGPRHTTAISEIHLGAAA